MERQIWRAAPLLPAPSPAVVQKKCSCTWAQHHLPWLMPAHCQSGGCGSQNEPLLLVMGTRLPCPVSLLRASLGGRNQRGFCSRGLFCFTPLQWHLPAWVHCGFARPEGSSSIILMHGQQLLQAFLHLHCTSLQPGALGHACVSLSVLGHVPPRTFPQRGAAAAGSGHAAHL